MRNIIDPISLNDIDDSNEWLIREMSAPTSDAEDDLVFDYDNLTWDDVARASAISRHTKNIPQSICLNYFNKVQNGNFKI